MDYILFLKLIEKMTPSGIIGASIYYFADHIVKHDKEILNSIYNQWSVLSIAKAFFSFMSKGDKFIIQNWELYDKYENFRDEIKKLSYE